MKKHIRTVFRTAGKPFAALWGWAAKPRAKGQLSRFRALQAWAKRHKDNATDAAVKAAWRVRFRAYRAKAKAKLHWLQAHKDPQPGPLLTTFDGRQVPAWIVHDALAPARLSGAWSGTVISGYRSPEYSTSLCVAMCGAPSCPGMCAGRSSNHACPPSGTGVPYEGAVDVTDYYGLRRWCETHGNPLIGGGAVLPRDLPHFSRRGN